MVVLVLVWCEVQAEPSIKESSHFSFCYEPMITSSVSDTHLSKIRHTQNVTSTCSIKEWILTALDLNCCLETHRGVELVSGQHPFPCHVNAQQQFPNSSILLPFIQMPLPCIQGHQYGHCSVRVRGALHVVKTLYTGCARKSTHLFRSALSVTP